MLERWRRIHKARRSPILTSRPEPLKAFSLDGIVLKGDRLFHYRVPGLLEQLLLKLIFPLGVTLSLSICWALFFVGANAGMCSVANRGLSMANLWMNPCTALDVLSHPLIWVTIIMAFHVGVGWWLHRWAAAVVLGSPLSL